MLQDCAVCGNVALYGVLCFTCNSKLPWARRLLEVDAYASEVQVKSSFKRMAVAAHPDKHGGNTVKFRTS